MFDLKFVWLKNRAACEKTFVRNNYQDILRPTADIYKYMLQ